jgi:hypothetical protein
MIYILFIPTFIGLVLFTTMVIIEEYLIPKLKPTSKFKSWWRKHIKTPSEEFGD